MGTRLQDQFASLPNTGVFLFFAHHIVEYPVIEAASYSKSYSVLEKIDFELWHIFTAYVD
jgi:hypothetical protein